MTEGLSVSPRRLEELRAATASGCALQVTMKGWRARKSGSDLHVRLYIAEVHRSHQGIQGCICLAKDSVYWPLMNQEITVYVSQCSACNMHRPEECKEPMVPHDVSGRPWAKLVLTCLSCRDSITYCWSIISPISSS